MKYLKHNINYLQSISDGAELYPVIKANAYGHGFKQVAQEIDKHNIKGVCIATINELQDLINLEVNYSILHLGKIAFSDLLLYEHDNVIATINSMDDIDKISALFISIDLPSNIAFSDLTTDVILFDELTAIIVRSVNNLPSILLPTLM